MVLIKNPLTIIQGGSPTPTPTVEEKDINFYDYDGTLLESWTTAELQTKTELPSPSAVTSHTGLQAQGWNWSLGDLKTYVAKMDVGMNYIPTDGKTHIFVNVTSDALSIKMRIKVLGTATVNWGDNTTPDTATDGTETTETFTHTYTTAGDYEVTIGVSSGASDKITIIGGTYGSYLWDSPDSITTAITSDMMNHFKQVKEIWIGTKTKLGDAQTGVFSYLSASKISIPKGIVLAPAPFKFFTGVKFIALPNDTTFTAGSSTTGYFSRCIHLEHLSLPLSVSNYYDRVYMREGFAYCESLKRLFILKANSSSSVDLPQQLCSGCESLEEVQIYANVGGTINQGALLPSTTATVPPRFTVLDFTRSSAVPTLSSNAIPKASAGLVIKVPASLETSWKSSWSSYANYIVGV